MAINKVVYGNDTLIDLTNDTVEASNLLEGETAHDRSGNPVSGTAKQGHVVQNSSGTDMTPRSKLQFADAEVSDDSTNGKTVVTVVREMTRAEYNLLSTDERKGIIHITDEPDIVIGEVVDDYVEVEGDGEKTYSQVLADLLNLLDSSKLTTSSVLRLIYTNGTFEDLQFEYKGSSAIRFYNTYTNVSNTLTGVSISLGSTCYYNSTSGSKSSTLCPDGEKIRIYYGTKSAPIELTTDAEHCMLSSGVSVESALTITKTQFTPKVGVHSSLATRNFYVTDNRTFLEVHFCLISTTSIADQSEIMDLPTIAQNKLAQYDVAVENKSRNAYIVSNSNTALVLTGATTAQNGNYLFGTFRMSLLADK